MAGKGVLSSDMTPVLKLCIRKTSVEGCRVVKEKIINAKHGKRKEQSNREPVVLGMYDKDLQNNGKVHNGKVHSMGLLP